MSAKITTRIQSIGGARGKHWAKRVTRIDPSKSNGYAFVGDWVRLDETVELPVGAVIVACDDPDAISGDGFRARKGRGFAPTTKTLRVLQVFERGIAELIEVQTSDKGWALQIRPTVEQALGTQGERFFKLVLSESQLALAEQAAESMSAADPLAERENEALIAAIRSAEEIT